MENPYEVPQSTLEGETLSLRKKTGWKIFFWFFFVLYVVVFAFMYIDETSSLAFDVTETLVYSGVLVGLYCFAYNKCFLQPLVWKIFFPIAIGWDIFTVWSSYMEMELIPTSENLMLILFFMLIISPAYFFQYLALYKYAFQSQEIWGK